MENGFFCTTKKGARQGRFIKLSEIISADVKAETNYIVFKFINSPKPKIYLKENVKIVMVSQSDALSLP